MRSTTEDIVDYLSGSELEVTGWVFAHVEYFAHDLNEVVPLVFLVSLEVVDAECATLLIKYFNEYNDRLLIAPLPEDADALPDEYQRESLVWKCSPTRT